jgi:hypothetical protein
MRIAQWCVANLDVVGAGVSIMTQSGVREIVCSTDEVAELLETLQFTLGVGPCVDAARQRSPVLVSDISRPDGVSFDRWPAFMDAVSAAGVAALFSFPLCIGAIAIGALDLYRRSPGALTDDELARGLAAADTIALRLLSPGADDRVTSSDPGPHRFAQVHQATGMIQAQLGIPTDQAFLMLRARAFASERPVVDIARDVVERRIRFSLEET